MVKDNGVICNVFDTSPCKKKYDVDELKGLSFGNGDITINWQYTIPPGQNNSIISGAVSPTYDNFQFGIILRRYFNKDGVLSSVAF
jgi:hypothetical protein